MTVSSDPGRFQPRGQNGPRRAPRCTLPPHQCQGAQILPWLPLPWPGWSCETGWCGGQRSSMLAVQWGRLPGEVVQGREKQACHLGSTRTSYLHPPPPGCAVLPGAVDFEGSKAGAGLPPPRLGEELPQDGRESGCRRPSWPDPGQRLAPTFLFLLSSSTVPPLFSFLFPLPLTFPPPSSFSLIHFPPCSFVFKNVPT